MTNKVKMQCADAMRKLNIYKPYIKAWEDKGTVTFYERYGGYWLWQEPDVMEKMRKVEQEYECVCYAATHEYSSFGEMWSFLVVDDGDSLDLVEQDGDVYYVYALVWNVDQDFVEGGEIGVKSFGGGLQRVC